MFARTSLSYCTCLTTDDIGWPWRNAPQNMLAAVEATRVRVFEKENRTANVISLPGGTADPPM
jgi:hypothetical protein